MLPAVPQALQLSRTRPLVSLCYGPWWRTLSASSLEFICGARNFGGAGQPRFCGRGNVFCDSTHLLAGPLALGALFLAGAMHVQMRDGSRHLNTAILPFADGQELTVVAHVTRSGRMHPGNFGEMRQVVDVESETVATEDGIAVPVRSGIRLSIYSPQSGDQILQETKSPTRASQSTIGIFHYGERLRFSGKLRPPRNFRNPGAFDYEGYLAENGIAALGSAKAENVELLTGFSGNHAEAWLNRIREGFLRRVDELWRPREAALIDAMVIGEEAFIDRDTRVDFQRSGTYHILIVSGMNVSILAFVVFWTLRRVRVGEVPATLMTVGFCVAYALLTQVGARVAGNPDVRDLPVNSVALSRACHAECGWGRGIGGSHFRSAPIVRRKFSDDISVRANRRSDWIAHA